MINQSIATPDGTNWASTGTSSVSVDFENKSGTAGSTPGLMGDDTNGHSTSTRVCEVCHSQNKYHNYNTANNTGGTTHNNAAECTGCHSHKAGFAPVESKGGYYCSACHVSTWQGMTGAVAKTTKHTLGNVAGTNDAYTDSGISWGNPLSGNAPAARSCVNMCHDDHIHNATDAANPNAHNYDVYVNSSSSASRAATTKTVATKDTTDYESTSGGMCLSCHTNPVDANHPALSQSAYQASAHNSTSTTPGGAWTYTLHDGSTFARNCTKCHSDRGDAMPNDSGSPFGAVHFSDWKSLLAGSTNPGDATTTPTASSPANFICYNCHGNGTIGTNYSGKDLATEFAKVSTGYGHPVNSDNVHNSVTEFNNAAFGNTLGGVSRHANCIDCHDEHSAKQGLHSGAGTLTGNAAAPALQSAWGAKLSSYPANWTAPAAGNFTKTTITAGTDIEATLCFKCHSAYYGTLPTSPSGGFQETDQALEFNPNNASSHPVVTNSNNFGNPWGYAGKWPLASTDMVAPWTNVGNQTMTCTDCHGNDSASPAAQGPHGSAVKFMLTGTNRSWPYQGVNGSTTLWTYNTNSTNSGTVNGLFCLNCHNISANRPHTAHSEHQSAPCVGCHVRIPHGSKISRLIVMPNAPSQYQGVTPYLDGFTKASSGTGYSDSNCGSSVSACNQHMSYQTNTKEHW